MAGPATCSGRCREAPAIGCCCLSGCDRTRLRDQTPYEPELTMLWTILIILAIVALAIWILSRVRGGRV
jgi:hypothetical protein